MNEQLIEKLRCLAVMEYSELLLNLKWGVDCKPTSMQSFAFQAGCYLWLLESGCQLDIITMGKIDKFVNQVNQTAYRCASIKCETKQVTIDCSTLTITDQASVPCDLIITDVTPELVAPDDP